MALLALIFVPAGIYGVYVLGQLDDIREHNLRGLDNATRAVEGLLENARKSVADLSEKIPTTSSSVSLRPRSW
jgi:hypothetical protein